MSGSRKDLTKAKLRRERIRQEKHAQRPPAPPPMPPPPDHAFASERTMRDIHALLEGQQFDNVDEVNARLAELTSGGRLPELAAAWKQDDPKWRAQQLAYDALETDDPIEALRLVTEAQELDPDCTDAQRLMVSLHPMDDDSRLRLMREVVDKAEQNLGEMFFAENMGHFWGVVETRPYMRAKLHLAELLCQQGRFDESITIYERILELNTRDNLGARSPLLGLYLAQNQPARAAALLDQYPGEEKLLASPAWGRVLERWLAGAQAQAQAALSRARKVNPHAEPYVSGRKEIPAEGPSYFRPGDETDAQVCAIELALAWRAHPEFRKWLRDQPPAPR
jgi:tetratricopeptide (TPR) repeat protein